MALVRCDAADEQPRRAVLAELLGERGVGFAIVTGGRAGEPDPDRFWEDYAIDEGVFEAFLREWL